MSTTISVQRTIEIRQHIWIDVPKGLDPKQFARQAVADAEQGIYDDEEWLTIDQVGQAREWAADVHDSTGV